MNICLVLKSSTLWPVYLGILEVFDGEKIPFHAVMGSGSGALVGSLYSFYPDGKWLVETGRQLVLEDKWKLLGFEKYPLELSPGKKNFLSLDKHLFSTLELEGLFPSFFQGKNLEEALVSLEVVALNLRQGVPVVLSKGPLIPALLSTLSIPGYFPYYPSDQGPMVDPYLVEPLSVQRARESSAGQVIALCPHFRLAPLPAPRDMTSMETISRIHYLQTRQRVSLELERADYAIEIESPFLSKFDVETFDQLVALGRRTARANLWGLFQWMEKKATLL